MMFFDFTWKRKPSQDDLTVLLGKAQKEAADKETTLREIRAILEPFDGLRQSETVVEQVQTVRDILLSDRAIIRQQSRDIESLQEQLQEVNRQVADRDEQINNLVQQQVMLATTTPTKKPATRSRSKTKA